MSAIAVAGTAAATLEGAPFVARVEYADAAPGGASMYYGMNVSPSLALEPVDQVDGFLVARAAQERVGGRFYALVAGQYECLNAANGRFARNTSANRRSADRAKKGMLECVLRGLALEGEIVVTADLWGDPEYWAMVADVAKEMDPGALGTRAGLALRDFPLEALGAAPRVLPRDVIDAWSAPAFYVPVEVGEAVWLREKRGVAYKVGPESERLYDRFIGPRGMGIVVMKQPRCMVRAKTDANGGYRPAQEVECVPYIGKAGQERVLFSDTLADIGLRLQGCGASYERAVRLARCYQDLGGFPELSKVQAVNALVRLGGLRG